MTGISGMADNLESRIARAYGFGFDFSYMLREHTGVGTGIEWRGYAFTWRQNTGSVPTDYLGEQAQINIPVYFRYMKNDKFVFDAGVINSFVLGGQQKIKTGDEVRLRSSYARADADYRRYTIAPFVYFGCHIGITRNMSVTAGPEISYQVSSNFSKQSGLSGHHLCAGIKLGLAMHAIRTQKKATIKSGS